MTDYLDFTGPEGLRTRGTVLVVPGRGRVPPSTAASAAVWRLTPTACGWSTCRPSTRLSDPAGSLSRVGTRLI
nr:MULTISPECIES: hypothetical protein [Protofrankia]